MSRVMAVEQLASQFFYEVTSLSPDIRPDEKKRTGVRILVRCPGSREIMRLRVADPSEAASFFCIEKAVRSEVLGDYSSMNSADESIFRFAGSVTVNFDGEVLQCSVSGLKPEEDTALSVRVLALLFAVYPRTVCDNIRQHGGVLPESFEDKSHYLHGFVNKPVIL